MLAALDGSADASLVFFYGSLNYVASGFKCFWAEIDGIGSLSAEVAVIDRIQGTIEGVARVLYTRNPRLLLEAHPFSLNVSTIQWVHF